MKHLRLVGTWNDGLVIPFTVRRSRVLPGLVGADSVVLMECLNTRLELPTPALAIVPDYEALGVLDADELRHEATHVRQQFERRALVWPLRKLTGTLRMVVEYALGRRGRFEREAEAAASSPWPRISLDPRYYP